MSKTPVIVIALLALALGVAALFLLRQPSGGSAVPPVAWLVNADASKIASIRVEWGDKSTQMLIREAMTGEWVIRRDGQKDWPIAGERLRPFLRLMNDAARLPPEPGAGSPSRPITLAFKLESGETHTILLSNVTLGGKTLAEIDDKPGPRRVMVDDGLIRMVHPESLMAWRELRAIPRNGLDPTRIRLETLSSRISLARVQGRWGVTDPLQAPSSAEAVTALLRQVASLRAERLADGARPDDPAMGADTPSPLIVIESDLRVPSGDAIIRRTLVEEIRVGLAADMSGSLLHAVVRAWVVDPETNAETALWGPCVLVVSKAEVDKLSAAPATYISGRALQFPSADVSRITLEPMTGGFEEAQPDTPATQAKTYRQTVDGWATDVGGFPKPLEREAGVQIAGLVRALCEVSTTQVGVDVPGGATPLARCTVQAVGASAGEVVLIGVAEVGGKPTLILKSGNIVRQHADTWVPGFVDWLRSEVK